MQRFLPSLWLLAAALYATAALFLDHTLYEKALMAQVAAHETRQGRSVDPAAAAKRARVGQVGWRHCAVGTVFLRITARDSQIRHGGEGGRPSVGLGADRQF